VCSFYFSSPYLCLHYLESFPKMLTYLRFELDTVSYLHIELLEIEYMYIRIFLTLAPKTRPHLHSFFFWEFFNCQKAVNTTVGKCEKSDVQYIECHLQFFMLWSICVSRHREKPNCLYKCCTLRDILLLKYRFLVVAESTTFHY
jgi:hypothetical protein